MNVHQATIERPRKKLLYCDIRRSHVARILDEIVASGAPVRANRALAMVECASPAFAEVRDACLTIQQDAHAVLKTCETLLETSPSKADAAAAHYNRGVAYLSLKLYYLAVSEFNQSIATDAVFYAAWVGRAEAHLRLRKFELAGQDIRKALSLEPDNFDGQDIRALIARETGATDQLLDAGESEIKLNPNRAEGYERRGEAYSEKGEIGKANANFLHATSLKPAWAYAWARLGTSYAMNGDTPHATDAFDKALAIAPSTIEALVNRAKLKESDGATEDASLAYRAALERSAEWTRERQLQKEALEKLVSITKHVPRAKPITGENLR